MQVGLRDAVIRVAGDPRSHAAVYQDHLERIIAAEQLGYEFIWFGEHHFMANPWNPSSLMLLAALSLRTSHMRLGTSVLLTPFYHPVRLAEEVAQLDLMSNGRIDLVLGTASIRGEFETFGVEPDERFGRTWEVMGFLRRCYESEETFDHDGKYFHFPHVHMTTQPVQKPFPLWFGGMGPQMLRRAGRNGVHLQTAGLDPRGSFGQYLEGLREGGRALENMNVATSSQFVVVDSESKVPEARERARVAELARREEYSPRGRDLAFERGGHPRWGDADNEDGTVLGVPVGTPDQVLKVLERRLKNTPATHLETFMRPGSSTELTAREILPTLKTWGRSPVQAPTPVPA
jgi:alkanesulfonate monooxygenase SsuD/methylene tetrahydromethanopterin reductase-like flavin-dependent oxidoreductase (luciferase family)